VVRNDVARGRHCYSNFDSEADPIITQGGQHLAVYRRTTNSAGKSLRWTISDFDGPMSVVINDIEPGEVHIHRDQSKDEARIYMMQTDGTWNDCTSVWCRTVEDPPRHPQDSAKILDALGSAGLPVYINDRTYKTRKKGRSGLLVEKSV